MKSRKFASTPQAGFTLVEIMVGLVIGMLATVIIMQVLSVFEAQKRTTTGSADAQTNGNIALYDIQRDLQQAGYALFPYGQAGTPDSPLECSSAGMTYGTTGITSIAPVTIVDGGAQGSDSITIRYGNSLGGGVPTLITAAPTPSLTVAAPAQDVPVTSSQLCNANDIALIINGNKCSITKVPASGVPNATTVTIENATPIANNAAVVNATLACLGNWNTVTYAVNNGNLERNGVPILPGIVNLQAQYGISLAGVASSSANFNHIDQWVDATGGTWAAPSDADRNRIKAVRIAVIARNAKMDPAAGTTACSSRTTASPTGLCAWDATSANPPTASPAPAVDLSASDPNWANYRYRVFDTIVPLRNVIWSRGTL